MSTPHEPEEFKHREPLKERELDRRLRELEEKLFPPPVHQAATDQPENRQWQQRQRQIKKLAIFAGIVISLIVVLRVATLLAELIVIGVIAFVIYKLFFDDDQV